MKILYIIGNGLDIAHNMKTSYQDFFTYYLALPSTDRDILAMKKDIDNHKYETWADLEMGLGSYSSKCADKAIFLKCLIDIKGNLKEYLQKESQKIGQYRLNSMSSFYSLDIITFNYTMTLESLLDFKNQSLTLSPSPHLVTLRSIQHVHGTLDNMMVMGVNDSTQITNNAFNTDLDVVEDFIKPEYNDACLNNKNSICESLIMEADVIVLYGTSLGLSDTKWWKLIGNLNSAAL